MNYYFMESSFARAEKKRRIYLIIVPVVIIIMVISFLLAINIVDSKNHRKFVRELEAKRLSLEVSEQEKVKELERIEAEKKKIPPVPVLTDLGRQNMSSIYNSEEKIAYLTFDDGPSRGITEHILNVLKEHDIKATFFVLGSRADIYPDLIKREYEEGHYIANHGYSHVYKDIYANPYAVLDEYIRTENSIKTSLGIPEYNSHLFRFPGGSTGGTYKNIKNDAKNILKENNVEYVDWNCLTEDGNYREPTKEQLIEGLLTTSENKGNLVVLMHDSPSKQITADTLPDVINILKEKGYEFRNFYDVIK